MTHAQLTAPQDLTDEVMSVFTDTHGTAPTRVARAAGRVNLIGEHVDYLGGTCLPITIPYATWVAATLREDDVVRLTSAGHEPWTGRRGDLVSGGVEGWARYVLAALNESTHDGGVDLHVTSTVPVGAGLSSSAALICAVLRAVDDRSDHDLVAPAIRAETDGVGVPSGGMDQTVSLLATVGQALRLNFSTGRHVQVPWLPGTAGLQVLVVDTGVQHANDDGAFARVRSRSEEAMAAKDPTALPSDLAAAHRHVTSEIARVDEFVDAVVSGDWRGVGAVMTASHGSLRDDLGVSCPELDVVVETALASGALGARMTGGGFGGCAIALVPRELTETLIAAVADAFAERGWNTPRFLIGDAEGPATRLL
ncbi:galactokinase [Nocardioides yefusunii]|uniref:Galactokinase n=1 Tax=Nocardioides yefusunii TaxID=2500546 RepID=A0ABW1QSP2_9ACTN|nr:galactokinase family protein [Nocardioides yefusunii]